MTVWHFITPGFKREKKIPHLSPVNKIFASVLTSSQFFLIALLNFNKILESVQGQVGCVFNVDP